MLGVAPCRPLMAPHLAPTRTDVGAGVRAAATSVGSSTVGWQLAIDSGFADRDHPQVVGRQMLRCGDRVEPGPVEDGALTTDDKMPVSVPRQGDGQTVR